MPGGDMTSSENVEMAGSELTGGDMSGRERP